MRQTAKKPSIIYSLAEFEKITGMLWKLKHIEELKYIGLTLMPDTDGSYRPNADVLKYLKKFCKDNPGYHIVSETHYSDELSESMGKEARNWIVRTFVNSCADLNYTRRYYLADGYRTKCEMISLQPDSNVVPFRRV